MKLKFTNSVAGSSKRRSAISKSLLGLAFLTANAGISFGQCAPDVTAPVITCPSNVTVNNTPGSCDATVTYSFPVATDNCSTPGLDTYNYTGSMQTFIVPPGVTTLTIEVNGAQGGNGNAGIGGNGAQMTGEFTVTPGQVLNILVGQQPTGSNGGGGGTFVVDQATGNPLIIAGGGGGGAGSCCGIVYNGVGGVTTTNGTDGVNASGGNGAGGVGGNGGSMGFQSQDGGAGGGFLSNGADGQCSSTGGLSYQNGGAGGNSGGAPNMFGGYGGGGGGHNCGWTYGAGGGGGGYSGGGSTGGGDQWGGGGGGGSFNAGINQNNTAAINTGNGSVQINYNGGLTVSLTSGLASGSVFPEGTSTVTYEAEDASTNTATCSFTITVVDAEGPLADNASLANLTDECSVTPVAPTATDNCTGPAIGTPNVSFPITAQGPTVVTWTYDDGNGNTSTQNQNVTINDVTTPVADQVTLADYNGCNNANPTPPTATDNCAGSISGIPDVTMPISTLGTTLVTWTYDDGNGNSITQTQNVIVTTLDVTTSMTDVITISATTSGATYQWIDCDNANAAITGETNQSFTASANGNYAVIVDNGTCADTSACVAITSVGISENSASKITVYPSPTNGDYTLDLGQVYESITVQITDLSGKVVETYVVNNTSKIQKEFNGADGMYLINIQTENKTFVATLVIE